MIRYIKQSGKPDLNADLTFADLEYQPDNDDLAARRWRRNTTIVVSLLGAIGLAIIIGGVWLSGRF